ncbi:MAG: hypothetical protein AAFX93_13395 [Verrucomicrobiota bacterium]
MKLTKREAWNRRRERIRTYFGLTLGLAVLFWFGSAPIGFFIGLLLGFG